MRGSIRLPAVVMAGLLLILAVSLVLADAPANEHFQRTWARTDQGVSNGSVARTWIWGPEGNTGALQEAYSDSPGGLRTVQYFDKARMEINNPAGDPSSPFYVTNGLLVVELMTGQLQLGNSQLAPHAPAAVNAAGDANDPGSPTYAELAPLRSAPAVADGTFITARIDGNGVISNDPGLAGQNVTAAFRLSVPGIEHQVASPFWEFLNSTGPVIVNGQAVTERLFDPWFYATGYPITEAYWADVRVAGTVRLVLMQCFERRCLTYTPGNPTGFLTEAGNVGQHYYTWRYEQINGGDPTPIPTEPTDPVTDYEYLTGWGGLYTPITPLYLPQGMAIDANDTLWIADTGNDRYVQYAGPGLYQDVLESAATGPPHFRNPVDAAFSDVGLMYVLDSFDATVQVFDVNGVYQFQWGAEGSGNGQLYGPRGIAIHNNTVYVADTANHRVQMFDLMGVYQGQFGIQGTGNGEFRGPFAIAVDSQGNIYVADSSNSRVQKFNNSGIYLSQFGSLGAGDGQFSSSAGIDIGDDGFIYVTDHYNHRVQKFTPDGGYLAQWGTQGSHHGQFVLPAGIATDSDGNVYVSDSANSRVQKFTSGGEFLHQVTDNRRGRFRIPSDITLDQNGNLLVSDSDFAHQTLARYTPDGVPLDDYSLKLNGAGPNGAPFAAAVNAQGDIYVVDFYANHVTRFSSTWEYRGHWGTGGTGPGQFNGPQDIAIDADGNVYVTETLNNRVQKFNADGIFLDLWGGVGDGDGQFSTPWSIAIDGERVYVTDLGNDRVQVFNRDGDYLGQWGSFGTEPGQLDWPTGIGVNSDGYVLVVEYTNNRVQVFTPEGESVGMFGELGTGEGQFSGPLAVVVDADGYAYVTEVGNHRVQKFVPAP